VHGLVLARLPLAFLLNVSNSSDNLRHPRSDAYSLELVLLNKRRISGGGACLHCYRKNVMLYSHVPNNVLYAKLQIAQYSQQDVQQFVDRKIYMYSLLDSIVLVSFSKPCRNWIGLI